MVKLTGNERFVYDSYRRLVQMFGSVVLGIPDEAFEEPLEEYKAQKGVQSRYRPDRRGLEERSPRSSRTSCTKHQGFDFPQDPLEQLRLATEAVFKSWNGKRAIDYRRAEASPTTWAPRSTS